MAKRKAARSKAPRRSSGQGRKTAGTRAGGRRRGRATKAARRGTARKTARRSARPAARKSARASARKPARRRSAQAAKKSAVRKTARRRPAEATAKKSAARQARPAPRRSPGRAAPRAAARKMPALDRTRRTVQGDDIVSTPPSSLDLDRSASAARTGRRELSQKFREHTETSPALTGGDIDADWESAYSVGDEAPGGDNPTPDQDIVDDIGRAVGVEYEDNEELKGEKKISDRDKKRWELDPASAEDYDER